MRRLTRAVWGLVSLVVALLPASAHAGILAGGSRFTVLVKPDGTVWTWGQNNSGQLGDGTTTRRTSPVLLGLSDIVAIAAGHDHSVALEADGTVWTWGANGSGQLGLGNTSSSSSPVMATATMAPPQRGHGGKHTSGAVSPISAVGSGCVSFPSPEQLKVDGSE